MTEIISDNVEIPAADGRTRTAAIERPGAGATADWAILAHCFARDDGAAVRIGRALAERGLAVLYLELTGLGTAEGELPATHFSTQVAELVAAADWLRREHGAPRVLVGHSLGGAAVLAGVGEIPEVAAVATIGAPVDPTQVRRRLGEAAAGTEPAPAVEPALALGPDLLADIERWDLARRAGQLRAALLVFHSPLDGVVPIEHGRRLFAAAPQPKGFVSLDAADHRLGDRRDADYVAAMLDPWLARYVPAPEAAPAPAVEPGQVRVVESGLGPLANDVYAGGHRLAADEPEAAGGSDTGPGPYDYLLAGLGACTSMTLRMYARHKGIALGRVAVTLRHDRVHADDCADCEHREGHIDRIERHIRLSGDLDERQRERLLQIADRCPVHRTLTGVIEIRTRETQD
ncbi:MAG: OsmC family protein [Halofilum sp. (in: g-proteobacteria)]|nr:OsmC family protein [Halofilum sp. (in: g-proteobacteria)]